jgi:signal transduction histidine kinase
LIVTAAGGVLAIPAGLVGWAAVAILLASYLVGQSVPRSTVVVSVLATAIMFGVAATVVAGRWWTGLAPIAIAAMLVGAAVGDAVRSRREAAEQESRRRVVEERLRIARDVHDLVAHHIAVVNVQAGVATHLLRDRPEVAAEALDQVSSASKAVLDELGTLLGVLRDNPTEPTPGLADLPSLLDSVAAAGLRVDQEVVGQPRPLPPAVDVSAYRILREGLTNAGKHGNGRARLILSYAPDRLHIEIRNERVSTRAGTGHGLTGMRERVVALGGELRAGPEPGGEFVVRASMEAK